jgi:broad specificity phosphatase PhoE
MKTRYECRLDWHEETDATPVHGYDPADAARRYAEWYDANAVEYPGERVVLVLVGGAWRRFEVLMRQVPEYEAREIDQHGKRLRRGGAL